MTDARDYMISDERKAELDNKAAIADAKAALHAAGFRILGPDEVDPVTVERCATAAERYTAFPSPTSKAAQYHIKHCFKPAIAAAIRSLGKAS